MRRLLVVTLVLALFAACGEEQKSATPDDNGAGGNASSGLSTLNRPAEGQPENPAPPPDPEAALWEKANRYVDSNDIEERMEAITLLKDAKNQAEAGRIVARLLFDTDEDVRSVAAEAIGSFDYPGAASNIRTLLQKEESSLVRIKALQGLTEIAGKEALPDLAKALEGDLDANVKATAANLLGRLKAKEAVGPLIKALENEFNEAVLLQAITALHKIGSPEAVDPAIAALEYQSNLVRAEAAKTLGDLGDEKAIGPLVDALTDTEGTQVLVAAIGSLLKLTGEDPETMGLSDEDGAERQKAVVAAWKSWWEEQK